MKAFGSCLFMTLAVVGGLILLVVLLFEGGDLYGRWRMAQVTQGLASLARELGYTAGDHLHHEIVKRDVNLVSGGGICYAKLYFTTSMSVGEFTERLNQVRPETKVRRWTEPPYDALYTILDLTVNGVDAWKLAYASYRKPIESYSWPPVDKWEQLDQWGQYIRLYEMMTLDAVIGYKGRQVKGNIVDLHQDGGSFPIWVQCPVTFSDDPAPPYD